MNGSIAVKQADVVLNTFPLNYQLNYTAEDSLRDLDWVGYYICPLQSLWLTTS